MKQKLYYYWTWVQFWSQMVLWAMKKLLDKLEMNWKQFGRYWMIYFLAVIGTSIQEHHIIRFLVFFTAGFLMSNWSKKTEK